MVAGGDNNFNGPVHIVGQFDELKILGADVAVINDHLPQPIHQARPVLSAHQHDGKAGDLAGLHQGQRFEEFVECAETAGQDNKALRVFDEHDLAHEEVAEVNAHIDPVVHSLLERQFNTQANRKAIGLYRAAICGLHHAGPTASDDAVPGFGQGLSDLDTQLVVLVAGLDARGAEYAYRTSHFGKRVEAFDEFTLNSQHAPGILVRPVPGFVSL